MTQSSDFNPICETCPLVATLARLAEERRRLMMELEKYEAQAVIQSFLPAPHLPKRPG